MIYYTVVVNRGRLETSLLGVLSRHKREEQEVRRSQAELERPQAMFTEVEKTGLKRRCKGTEVANGEGNGQDIKSRDSEQWFSRCGPGTYRGT